MSTSAPPTPAKDLEEIANRRAGGACDHGDLPDERGQGAFAGGIEKPFAGQFFAELAEGEFQRAHATGLDLFDDQLITAARGVDLEAAFADDFQAVVHIEAERAATGAPHGRFELRPVVLKREVAMARLRTGEVRYFACDPDAGEGGFDQVFDLGGQLPDRERARGNEIVGKIKRKHY